MATYFIITIVNFHVLFFLFVFFLPTFFWKEFNKNSEINEVVHYFLVEFWERVKAISKFKWTYTDGYSR